MMKCDQAVKFFVRNVVNECICAHVKVFKLYWDEGLESLSVFKAMNSCLYICTTPARVKA
jgi:hypothetical protein